MHPTELPSESLSNEAGLIARAVAGDRVALSQLLMLHGQHLTRRIERKLPSSVRGTIDVDDILQETFVEAFRAIGQFDYRSDQSFRAWLTVIAERCATRAVTAQKRVKRGGGHNQIRNVGPTQSRSAEDLVELLSAGSHTPSRSVRGHEAVQAVQDVIRGLPDHYQQAVQLRLLEGKSLAEVSAEMDCTPRAVQGIIDRAKAQMRAALERLSRYE